MNEYAGYTVPVSLRDGTLPKLDTVPTPRDMFTEYIAQRKPVVLKGVIDDFKGYRKWSNTYLAKHAGDSSVDVEVATKTKTFGTGNKTKMKFSEFLDKIKSGDTSHYLTTQPIDLDESSGQPFVTSSPVRDLLESTEDFVLRPAIFGNLVPMNCNVWIGNSEDGTSTGLHHDYHDNLYILLRGRKRFRLFSPADAQSLYTVGDVARVHANGRINYEGFPTNADGAEVGAEKAQQADEIKRNAEQELALAEQAVANKEVDAQERLRKAEQAMDDALDKVLEHGDDFDDFDMGEDDYQESDDENSEEEADPDRPPKKRKVEQDDVKEDPREIPLNFSRVKLGGAVDLEQFPRFAQAKCVTAEMQAGDMLYLPAGWFHEVSSFTDRENDDKEEYGGHLAFNYWMHPPTTANFDKPYDSQFWEKDWARRENPK